MGSQKDAKRRKRSRSLSRERSRMGKSDSYSRSSDHSREKYRREKTPSKHKEKKKHKKSKSKKRYESSSDSEMSDSDLAMLQKLEAERLRRKIYSKEEKERAKSMETPEEKRLRRLLKKVSNLIHLQSDAVSVTTFFDCLLENTWKPFSDCLKPSDSFS